MGKGARNRRIRVESEGRAEARRTRRVLARPAPAPGPQLPPRVDNDGRVLPRVGATARAARGERAAGKMRHPWRLARGASGWLRR